MAKKRAAKKVWQSTDPDDNMPQRKTADLMERNKDYIAIGTNPDGKELFDFVLKGMTKPDKK